ncbi:tyrosine-type recombinase/integrase [Pseudovibrio sp. Tun.PSC04-5.I4]|uniref:tyrosine-type recombinase/integrase n=1 Tax=Pseudovibrio sp. Tun.PSC04-5.I4 TaxID=1798213 RepID=UPI0008867286|nr:tyrosine-type recombinase/integrase [Pseudovibrio sp. Tun.PSC04-5.I4]SDR00982.1 Phage integrase family protein [Pseudovibrio sp. Tun.PSC04-5.I4]
MPPNLREIRTRHLATYITLRRLQPNNRNKFPAPATINQETQLLRTILRRALQVWELDLRLPNFKAVKLEEPDQHIVELSQDDQKKLKEHLREDFHDTLDFLILAGPRASNVLRGKGIMFRPEHVNLEQILLTFFVKSQKPGGRKVVLPITSAMAPILVRNLGNHKEAVFTYIAKSTRNGRNRGKRYPLSYSAFKTAYKAAANKIGKPELRVHDLRHTAATRTLRATGNIMVAKELLGHTRSTTTEKYAHRMREDFRNALEQAHISRKNPGEPEARLPKLRKKRRK